MHRFALTSLALLAPVLVAVPASAVGETCDGRAATIVVPAPTGRQAEPVSGTPGDDVIVGTEYFDTIDGAGGNDVICGMGGGDVIRGGIGNDRLYGGLDAEYEPDDGYFGDLVIPGPGDDYVDLGADPQALDIIQWADPITTVDRISYLDAAGPVSVDLTVGTADGEGTDTIAPPLGPVGPVGVIGSAFGDTIVGTTGDDFVDGRAGGDTISSLDGGDFVVADAGKGDAGDDVIDTGGDSDQVWLSGGSDRVVTGVGRDTAMVRGQSRDAVVRTGADDDSVWLMAPATVRVRAGSGDDEFVLDLLDGVRYDIAGGAGRDRSSFNRILGLQRGERAVWDNQRGKLGIGDRTGGRVSGLEAIMAGGPFHWTFNGSNADEKFASDSQVLSVIARGGGGSDVLSGTGSADVFDGGPGRDRANGGGGRDRCLRVERAIQCERRR